MDPKKLSIQGHRGARGLFPENTIRGFVEALHLGVNTLEMDVVISKDQHVVVSHEPWMNEVICSLPEGNPVKKGSGRDYNLYKMTYAEIRKFDCGRRGHPEFPTQLPLPAIKPLLKDVIQNVEKEIRDQGLFPVLYNIELKTEEPDGLYNPEPSEFVDLVLKEIKRLPLHRVHLQSFDVQILKEIRKISDGLTTGFLVENNDPLQANLDRLGFLPHTYSPSYELVDEDLINEVHKLNIKLIPWTINEGEDMNRLLSLGVDGIITDFPDRLIHLLHNKPVTGV